MYTVMIIDDEWMIREGLKAVINWEEQGFQVIDEADNGLLALQKIKANEPDVVLMDIRMPGLNGLEVIDHLKAEGFKGKFIILTGYDEFAYAKEAVHLHVYSYLLKPIDEEEMIKVLKELKEKLDDESQFQGQQESFYNLFLEKKLRQLLSNRSDQVALWQKQGKDCSFLDENSNYIVSIVESEYSVEVEELIKQRFTSNIFVLHMDQGYVLVHKDKTYEQLAILYPELGKHFFHRFHHHAFITIGRRVQGYHSLHKSYEDADRLIKRRFLYGKQTMVYWHKIDNNHDHHIGYMDIDYLYSLIEVGNLEALQVFLEKMKNGFITSDLSNETIKGLCGNCYISIKEKVILHYKQCQPLFEEDMKAVNKIYNANQLDDIMVYLENTFSKVSKTLCNSSPENTMKRILNYIHHNYSKSLRLEGLARLFNYNSSYLGKLFKEETGKSFNTYLDCLRIEHAKNLIESGDYKIYEVADKVGYKNVDYFYTKFRKYTGISPSKYKS